MRSDWVSASIACHTCRHIRRHVTPHQRPQAARTLPPPLAACRPIPGPGPGQSRTWWSASTWRAVRFPWQTAHVSTANLQAQGMRASCVPQVPAEVVDRLVAASRVSVPDIAWRTPSLVLGPSSSDIWSKHQAEHQAGLQGPAASTSSSKLSIRVMRARLSRELSRVPRDLSTSSHPRIGP
eukprot:2776694-Rhodomonas_salina.1